MTKRLKEAFARASRLPPKEQDALADWLMKELASDARWEEQFAKSPDALGRLAAEALAEHRQGRTEDLDPDRP
jgi:hypothetical protein